MKRWNWLITTLALLALSLLYLPLLAVMIFSFNATRSGFTWGGFTFRWYLELFQNKLVLEAAVNTLILALVSTLIATILGTLLAIAMDRFHWPRMIQSLSELVMHLPVVTPDIILAAAMVVALALLRSLWSSLWGGSSWNPFNPGLLAMILGHVTFQIAFVALVVRARLASISPAILEAARDLYADTPTLMWRVLLPLLAPGIAAGAMLAFTLSLDDFIVSFFTTGPGSETLPIYIYSSLRRGLNPQLHALSTVLFLCTVILVLLAERLTRTRPEKPESAG